MIQEITKKIYYKILIILLSIKWMLRINLGDEIVYKDRKYIVTNGVRCNCWRLSNLDNGDNGWVKRIECKKVITITNLLGSFKSGYIFYMTSWYSIWINVGIEPWMRNCRIW